jgi:hypothetical protein
MHLHPLARVNLELNKVDATLGGGLVMMVLKGEQETEKKNQETSCWRRWHMQL